MTSFIKWYFHSNVIPAPVPEGDLAAKFSSGLETMHGFKKTSVTKYYPKFELVCRSDSAINAE